MESISQQAALAIIPPVFAGLQTAADINQPYANFSSVPASNRGASIKQSLAKALFA
jgi:hypothetical protein